MIITLCGSARFENYFHLWNETLTLSGHTVYGLAVYPSFKKNKNWYSEEEKRLLDKAHLSKIEASDAILVLNKFAYIGESTLREIEYARKNKKELYALESWGIGCGVGPNHTKEKQILAKVYDARMGSPIDTTFPSFKQVHNLYPPQPGRFRSSLVEKVDGYDEFQGYHPREFTIQDFLINSYLEEGLKEG